MGKPSRLLEKLPRKRRQKKARTGGGRSRASSRGRSRFTLWHPEVEDASKMIYRGRGGLTKRAVKTAGQVEAPKDGKNPEMKWRWNREGFLVDRVQQMHGGTRRTLF